MVSLGKISHVINSNQLNGFYMIATLAFNEITIKTVLLSFTVLPFNGWCLLKSHA